MQQNGAIKTLTRMLHVARFRLISSTVAKIVSSRQLWSTLVNISYKILPSRPALQHPRPYSYRRYAPPPPPAFPFYLSLVLSCAATLDNPLTPSHPCAGRLTMETLPQPTHSPLFTRSAPFTLQHICPLFARPLLQTWLDIANSSTALSLSLSLSHSCNSKFAPRGFQELHLRIQGAEHQ